jgi:hypothetical protein
MAINSSALSLKTDCSALFWPRFICVCKNSPSAKSELLPSLSASTLPGFASRPKWPAGPFAHGKSKNVQRVFCGHTHEALSLSRDDVEYYNTGSWTQESATYVAIDHQGVRICEYQSGDPLHYDLGDGLEFDFDNLARVQSSE